MPVEPAELAEGVAAALFASIVGLVLTVPSFLLAGCGALVKSLKVQPANIRSGAQVWSQLGNSVAPAQ